MNIQKVLDHKASIWLNVMLFSCVIALSLIALNGELNRLEYSEATNEHWRAQLETMCQLNQCAEVCAYQVSGGDKAFIGDFTGYTPPTQ